MNCLPYVKNELIRDAIRAEVPFETSAVKSGDVALNAELHAEKVSKSGCIWGAMSIVYQHNSLAGMHAQSCRGSLVPNRAAVCGTPWHQRQCMNAQMQLTPCGGDVMVRTGT